MENPVFEAARTVLAVREYDTREIPDEVLHRIVEAGRLSGSAGNSQPWHFVVVRERAALEELGRLVTHGRYVATAAAAVAVAVEKASDWGVSDGSRAIQSMILTAWGEGVGSNWTGSPDMREVADYLGLPDGYHVIGVIPLGYPRRAIGRGRKNRKDASQVISAERYGTPYG